MRRLIIISVVLVLFTGCGGKMDKGTQASVDDFTVESSTAEVTEGDFVFRLFSEKEAYDVGEEVTLYGEIEYVGAEDVVTIAHSSSAIQFPMKEMTRDYRLDDAVNDIGLDTSLRQGEVYRADYSKSGGYDVDNDSKAYRKFVDDFLVMEGFPKGYYVVEGMADFAIMPSDGGAGERMEIKATVDFKVE